MEPPLAQLITSDFTVLTGQNRLGNNMKCQHIIKLDKTVQAIEAASLMCSQDTSALFASFEYGDQRPGCAPCYVVFVSSTGDT